MSTFAVLFALAVSNASLQSTTTHCVTAPFAAVGTIVDRQLVGCSPSDTDNVLWNLDRADGVSDGFYTRRTTGRGAVVYIIDTGVEAGHDEFQRGSGTNVIAGFQPLVEHGGTAYCATDVATHPCLSLAQVTTHGTAVASIVAGRTTGVAPNASIVAIEILGGNAFEFVWALQDIVKHAYAPSTPQFQTGIINMSYVPTNGTTDPDSVNFRTLMETMIGGIDVNLNADPNGKKFLFVTIAGNRNFPGANQCASDGSEVLFPGNLGPQIDGLITVGGIDQQNHFWSGSCLGDNVEILAPAENILCASNVSHDHYRYVITSSIGPQDYASGTSYAAPYVCGIAARMLEADPNLTPVELEKRIKASASFVSGDAPAGGRVAVFIDPAPPPSGPRRRAVGH